MGVVSPTGGGTGGTSAACCARAVADTSTDSDIAPASASFVIHCIRVRRIDCLVPGK
jgi:hypothetical protein